MNKKEGLKDLNTRALIVLCVCALSLLHAFFPFDRSSSFESMFFVPAVYLFALADFLFIWRNRIPLLNDQVKNPGVTLKSAPKEIRAASMRTLNSVGREAGLRVIVTIIPATILSMTINASLGVGIFAVYLFLGMIGAFFTAE